MAPARDRPDDRRTPAFEFCVHGQPLSVRTRSRSLLRAWQDRVRAAARAEWPPDQAPYSVAVELRMTLYATRSPADVDNLIKPIQDALEGVLFVNDRLVKDVMGNWRNIDRPAQTRHVSQALADAFGNGRPFVHIRLWIAPEDEELG